METALLSTIGGTVTTTEAASKPPRRVAWALAAAIVLCSIGVLWKLGLGTSEFNLEWAFFREGASSPLVLMDRISPGDRLFLEIKPNEDIYIYVLNEDMDGETNVLFPNPELDKSNPLPGGKKHRLPGTQGGIAKYWDVYSAGGTEHFLIVASYAAIPELEKDIAEFWRVNPADAKRGLPELAQVSKEKLRGFTRMEDRVRGVGPLVESKGPSTSPLRLSEVVRPFSDGSEVQSTNGVLVRNFQLLNPKY